MGLTLLEHDLIIGTLLGDGSLGTETGRTWRYRAIHKAAHKEYFDHKYDIMRPYCGSPPFFGQTVDRETGKVSYRWMFNTLVSPVFDPFANLFYVYDPAAGRCEKIVPANIADYLTPRALAYLFMDDGALKWVTKSNGMRICTEGFTISDTVLIQEAIEKNFNIKTSLTKKDLKDGSPRRRITIGEEASGQFREIIQPYLVDCMKYKVSDGKKGHL